MSSDRASARSRRSASYAFTLAELMLAMATAALAILLVVELAIASMRANQKGSDMMLANALAGQTVEQMVYALPAISDTTFWSTTAQAPPPTVYNSDVVTLNGKPFTADTYIKQLDNAQPGLKMVLVNVSWGSGAEGQTGYGRQVIQATRFIYAH